MKVSKLLLVVATLVVSAQSYGGFDLNAGYDSSKRNVARIKLPVETNTFMNKTGSALHSSAECTAKSSANKDALTNQKVANVRKTTREEVR